MLDKGLRIAEADGDSAELQGIYELCALFAAALELKCYDTAEAMLHLLLCKLMTGMALKAGIADASDCRMAFKETCNLHSVVAMLLNADIEGFKAAVDKICFKGPEDCACHILKAEHAALRNEIGFACCHARNDVSVTVEIFGCAVDDDIGAEVERPLDVRGGKGIINDDLCFGAGLMGELGNGFDIYELEARIGRGLEIENLSIGADGCADCIEILKIYEGDVNAAAGKAMGEIGEGAAVEGIIRKQMIACLERRPHYGGYCAHAACHCHACFCMLKRCELRTDLCGVGIAETGVDIALLLACETPCALGSGLEFKGRGLEDRSCKRCDTGYLDLSDMYLLRCEALVLLHNSLLIIESDIFSAYRKLPICINSYYTVICIHLSIFLKIYCRICTLRGSFRPYPAVFAAADELYIEL